jgi:hypothetical protein
MPKLSETVLLEATTTGNTIADLDYQPQPTQWLYKTTHPSTINIFTKIG